MLLTVLFLFFDDLLSSVSADAKASAAPGDSSKPFPETPLLLSLVLLFVLLVGVEWLLLSSELVAGALLVVAVGAAEDADGACAAVGALGLTPKLAARPAAVFAICAAEGPLPLLERLSLVVVVCAGLKPSTDLLDIADSAASS